MTNWHSRKSGYLKLVRAGDPEVRQVPLTILNRSALVTIPVTLPPFVVSTAGT